MGDAAEGLLDGTFDWDGEVSEKEIMEQDRKEHLYYKGQYCLECDSNTELVYGNIIYPHRSDLFKKTFYLCPHCMAYVGCHEDGRGFGTVAGPALRRARNRAHAAFDPLWKNKKFFSNRRKAYDWLAKKLGFSIHFTHIGMFDIPRVLISRNFL